MRAENSLEKSLMLGMWEGKRKKGRPVARWMDDIKTATKLLLKDLWEVTKDRDKWRAKVMTITKSRRRLDRTR
eukprot:gene6234-biopygen7885